MSELEFVDRWEFTVSASFAHICINCSLPTRIFPRDTFLQMIRCLWITQGFVQGNFLKDSKPPTAVKNVEI